MRSYTKFKTSIVRSSPHRTGHYHCSRSIRILLMSAIIIWLSAGLPLFAAGPAALVKDVYPGNVPAFSGQVHNIAAVGALAYFVMTDASHYSVN